ncbi:MAG TPA: xanthine dehydrogenase family protein molybdopterin-binding subunit [Gemmatimonadaceae bacterium]|nr:xanthine dehydrogenase family protein molybdopterin-binding subunit [Gemmatimonadaceae bacterium]
MTMFHTPRRRASVGAPLDRVDGRLKVTGGARYAAEFAVPNLAHGVIITSTIAKGRVRSMDTSAAERAPGVIKVLTPMNAPRLPGAKVTSGRAMRVPTLLQDDLVRYNGQPIGVVVADTWEHAREAADLVRVTYDVEKPVLDWSKAPLNRPEDVHPLGGERLIQRGDLSQGLAAAAVTIDHTYITPLENHNPMEVHSTIAQWNGDSLVLYESTQGITSVRNTVARHFGLTPDKVRVVAYFTGGGFGSKGGPWSHESLSALAAREVGRPVKLVLTRRQMFGPVGGRPRTEQRVTLGASKEGVLTAIRHHSKSTTSTIEDWVEPATSQTRLLYACPNVETQYDLVRVNVGSPTFMRAPGESTGTFALESAMDELAYALGMDPVALRLKNYAEQDPESGRPWSSKGLRECYASAAQRFGWSKRNPQPRSMRDGRWLVGWGMATATYPARRAPAGAIARMMPDGRVWVRAGTQEIGCGTYTSMTQIAADALGVAPEQVTFELGSTDMPENPASTGSVTAASTGSAVNDVATALRQKLIQMAIADARSPLHGTVESNVRVANGSLTAGDLVNVSETYAALLARNGGQPVEATIASRPGADAQQYSMHSFGAVFTEVRVDPDLGIVRVPRVVTAHAVGRILNAKTARSQIHGGVVWGVGMALEEETLIDPRSGRYINADLAEYHVPVNADIGEIDVAFIEQPDLHVSTVGAKGVGEIGITGVAASIANAVYHATGKRVRELPIRIEKVLA